MAYLRKDVWSANLIPHQDGLGRASEITCRQSSSCPYNGKRLIVYWRGYVTDWGPSSWRSQNFVIDLISTGAMALTSDTEWTIYSGFYEWRWMEVIHSWNINMIGVLRHILNNEEGFMAFVQKPFYSSETRLRNFDVHRSWICWRWKRFGASDRV